MMIFTLSLPLLTYSPKSQNHRVPGYEIPGEEQPKIFTTEGSPGSLDLDNLILAAYRQVFNEQQMLVRNRQKVLESQLRNGVITVRDFVRGLALGGIIMNQIIITALLKCVSSVFWGDKSITIRKKLPGQFCWQPRG